MLTIVLPKGHAQYMRAVIEPAMHRLDIAGRYRKTAASLEVQEHNAIAFNVVGKLFVFEGRRFRVEGNKAVPVDPFLDVLSTAQGVLVDLSGPVPGPDWPARFVGTKRVIFEMTRRIWPGQPNTKHATAAAVASAPKQPVLFTG